VLAVVALDTKRHCRRHALEGERLGVNRHAEDNMEAEVVRPAAPTKAVSARGLGAQKEERQGQRTVIRD